MAVVDELRQGRDETGQKPEREANARGDDGAIPEKDQEQGEGRVQMKQGVVERDRRKEHRCHRKGQHLVAERQVPDAGKEEDDPEQAEERHVELGGARQLREAGLYDSLVKGEKRVIVADDVRELVLHVGVFEGVKAFQGFVEGNADVGVFHPETGHRDHAHEAEGIQDGTVLAPAEEEAEKDSRVNLHGADQSKAGGGGVAFAPVKGPDPTRGDGPDEHFGVAALHFKPKGIGEKDQRCHKETCLPGFSAAPDEGAGEQKSRHKDVQDEQRDVGLYTVGGQDGEGLVEQGGARRVHEVAITRSEEGKRVDVDEEPVDQEDKVGKEVALVHEDGAVVRVPQVENEAAETLDGEADGGQGRLDEQEGPNQRAIHANSVGELPDGEHTLFAGLAPWQATKVCTKVSWRATAHFA